MVLVNTNFLRLDRREAGLLAAQSAADSWEPRTDIGTEDGTDPGSEQWPFMPLYDWQKPKVG